jgi:uncharacterized protein (TIGR01777 family)
MLVTRKGANKNHPKTLRILLTGASGTVARLVASHLADLGHQVIGVSRYPRRAAALTDPRVALISWPQLSPGFIANHSVDAILNFAGAPMIRRWDHEAKADILTSRIQTTRKIYQLLRQLPAVLRPECCVNASSVAIYSSPAEAVDEDVQPDLDPQFFQSRVWNQLEALVNDLQVPQVRSLVLRFGIVIGPHEMMRTMLRTSRWFLGAVLGSGKQRISWISHRDLARSIEFALLNKRVRGAINVVSPQTITASQLSTEIARSVNRRVLMRIPEPLLRAFLGELAMNFTTSATVVPSRLRQAGFNWELGNFYEAAVVAAHELGFVTSSPGTYGLPVKARN